MKLPTLLATGALLCATSQAMAGMSASQERQFLDDQHLSQRIATINTPSHSFLSTQGGSSGKACDNSSIPANVMTQVSSDNDTSEGNAGLWEATGSGFVSIINPGRYPVVCTADFFYGDQTTDGSSLPNYFHVIPVQWDVIAPLTGAQVQWQLLDTVPLLQDHEGDAMAYFLFLTCSAPVKCSLNAYHTMEFSQP